MNKVADRIAAEIRERGAMSFARFMELALYCPNCGYYEKEEDRIGRAGDYYTSVSAGGLFGELLALQIAEWLEAICGSRPEGGGVPAQVVEGGAHGGKLAGDILGWMARHRPELFERMEYWIIEPSGRRRAWQERHLAGYAGRVRWATDFAGLRRELSESAWHSNLAGVQGVIFCNELLDAMPVRRLGWDSNRRAWFEWGVTLQGDRFGWTRMDEVVGNRGCRAGPGLLTERINPAMGAELWQVLPDGFSVEMCPAAEAWWREAADALGHGRLMTIDYGLTAEESFVPERAAGTLRAYRGHQSSGDVLACPGEQDITAHVNFSAIEAAGEAAGLKTEMFQRQAQFLTAVAARAWQREGRGDAWLAERSRQFQTLTHPEHLGRPFRVLVQARG